MGGCCLLEYWISLLGIRSGDLSPSIYFERDPSVTMENIVERSLHYLLVEFSLFWILFWLPLWVVSRSTFGPLATVLFWDTELPFQLGLLLFFQRTLFG